VVTLNNSTNPTNQATLPSTFQKAIELLLQLKTRLNPSQIFHRISITKNKRPQAHEKSKFAINEEPIAVPSHQEQDKEQEDNIDIGRTELDQQLFGECKCFELETGSCFHITFLPQRQMH
jgi:hypothetical protein